MTFQLDKSGVVVLSPVDGGSTAPVAWGNLSPFAQGYIEALFEAHSIQRYRSDEDRIYSHGGFDMLAPETLARIIADCERYLGQTSITPERATAGDGRAFYVLRQSAPAYLNGPPMSQTMDGEPVASAYYFPPLTVHLGDDGKVRFA